MIDSGQFVNGLWMGIVLIVLGLVPGLLDKMINGLSDAARTISLRFPHPLRAPVPSRDPAVSSFPHRRWLAAAGLALIALSLLAYVSH